jgi:hypothetical protein
VRHVRLGLRRLPFLFPMYLPIDGLATLGDSVDKGANRHNDHLAVHDPFNVVTCPVEPELQDSYQDDPRNELQGFLEIRDSLKSIEIDLAENRNRHGDGSWLS